MNAKAWIFALLSLVFAGAASFAMLYLFFALVPRLGARRRALTSILIQWILIASVVIPAIAAAIFGPIWLYQVVFNYATTQNQRLWLIASGILALVLCFLAAMRSAAGRRYW